jgi:tetratricopeptide (TPR) repeat protein
MTATTVPEIEARAMTWDQYHEAGRRRFAEGDAAGAEQAFRGAIAEAEQPGGDPLQMASSLSSLGQLKYQQKDYAQAEDCFRRALELREQALGGDHPTVISSINNLAALYVARGALDDAEPLLQRAMAVTIKRVEASQADLAVNLNNLVRLYVKRGDYSRAEPMLTQLLAMKRPLGPEHPEVAAVLVTLAKLRQSMSQPDAAERIWRRVLAVRERTLPTNDTTIAATLDGLADACAAQGRLADELEMRERSLAIREVAQGPDHPSLPALRARVHELRQLAPPKTEGAHAPPARVSSQSNRVSSPSNNGPRRSSGAAVSVIQGPLAPTVVTSPERARLSNPGTTILPVAPQPAFASAFPSALPAALPSALPGASPAARISAPISRSSAPVTRISAPVSRSSTPVSRSSAAVSRASAPANRASGEMPMPEAPVEMAPSDAPSGAQPDAVSEPARVSGSSATRSQDIELSVSPTPSASTASAPVTRRHAEINEMATRKRGFHLSADRAAAEMAQPVKVVNPGRGKKIALAIAAVIAIAAVVLFAFGRDMLGGLLGEPPAAAPAVAASSASAPPATPGSATPGASAQGVSTPGTTAGNPRGSATTVANPSAATPHTTFQTSVTPAAAKPEHQKAANEAAPPKAADASAGALPVPTVNVDAATRSIDEATKGTPQKPKVNTPF